jgi:hypothetical protein
MPADSADDDPCARHVSIEQQPDQNLRKEDHDKAGDRLDGGGYAEH